MTRRGWLIAAVALCTWPVAASCDRGTAVAPQEVTVACGLCRFRVPGAHRCHWAADIGGKIVPVTGPAVPLDHEPHGPEGMCVVERRATVAGMLYDDKLIVDAFKLAPYSGPPSEAAPHEH